MTHHAKKEKKYVLRASTSLQIVTSIFLKIKNGTSMYDIDTNSNAVNAKMYQLENVL